MPDYKNGRIYCIRAPGTDQTYIGSTTLPLSQRMVCHRSDHKRYKSGKMKASVGSFALLDMSGSYIELIEEYPCESREQLNRREGEIIRATPTCLNQRIAGQTCSEYHKAHRDRISEQHREYYSKNKEKFKAYYQSNMTKIREYHRQRYAAKKATAIVDVQATEPAAPAPANSDTN